MTRRLSLNSETLHDLTSDDLTSVNAAAGFDPTIVATVCSPLATNVRCALSLTQCLTC